MKNKPLNPLVGATSAETQDLIRSYIDHLRSLYGNSDDAPIGLQIELEMVGDAVAYLEVTGNN